jgi:acetyl-CoA carboxylase carboxyltransferase component
MDEYHSGSSLTIWLWEGAEQSWAEAEAGVMEAHKAQFRARLARLADAGLLRVPDHMNSEGEGIHAVKGNTGLRAYGWFDQVNGRRAFIISHVILKKKQKLNSADLAKASARKASYGSSKE